MFRAAIYGKIFKRISSILIGLYFILHLLGEKKTVSAREYFDNEIYGRIDTIYSYQKSFPLVAINGLNQLLNVPYKCTTYIRKGDIIYKRQETLILTTYRESDSSFEIYKWGYINHDSQSEGIIDKRIKYK